MPKRRGKGEGTVYKAKDRNKYRAETHVGGRKLVRYFDTKREAQEWLAQVRADSGRGLLPEPSRITVAEFMAHWLEVSAKPSVRPPTYRQYEQYVRNHIIPGLGGIRLQALKAPDIQAFYHDRLNRGLSARSVRIIHAVLHRALGQAVRWGLLVFNPADRVDRPKIPGSEARALTREEIGRFLEAARTSKYGALFVLTLSTGLRIGEVIGLRWQDVDFEAEVVHVRRVLYRVKGAWVEGEPKSAAGKRKVTLPPSVIGILREHKKAQLEARLKAGPNWSTDYGELVFSTGTGRPLSPANIHRELKAVLRRAGLPAIRFHDLRHSHATLLLTLGENPRVVQERLGHSQVSITLQTYSHVLPDLQRETALKVERAVFINHQ